MYDTIDIYFNMTNFLFDNFILCSDSLKIGLKYDIHRIEKKWNIKNSISHREYFSCYRHRYKITKSDGCSRDHRKIECIKITCSNRITCLKSMNKKCSKEPRNEEYDTNDDEFSVVYMERLFVLVYII